MCIIRFKENVRLLAKPKLEESSPVKSPSFSSFSKHADFVALDALSLAVAFAVAYFLKFHNLNFVDSATWKGLLALLIAVNLALTLLSNPYSGIFRQRYWEDIGTQLTLALESFLVICVIFYLFKIGEEYSREMLIVTYAMYIALALLIKYCHKRRLLSRWNNRPPDSMRKLVLVTTSDNALKDEALVYADDMCSSAVVAFCLVDAQSMGTLGGTPTAPASDIVPTCARYNADEALILTNLSCLSAAVLEELMEEGLRVRIGISESLGAASETQAIGHVGVVKTLDLQRHSFGSGQALYLPAKRLCDIAIGLIGTIAILPIAAFVKISYLLQGDTHPIFYKQTRVGHRGRQFELWKLRSMVWNADEVLQEMLQDPERRIEWDRDQKFADDPRITTVGRILRRTSLDEFPQFFNILKGDMSVVGPRPLVPGELEAHGGRPLYNKVKPGLTGWWGCNGRSNIEYYERLELEYYYVTHCSLYLDALCIFRTAVAVFKREGAH